jgi:hypothetical protein
MTDKYIIQEIPNEDDGYFWGVFERDDFTLIETHTKREDAAKACEDLGLRSCDRCEDSETCQVSCWK